MGQSLCFSFCCLFVRSAHVFVCVCVWEREWVFTIIHQSVYYTSVTSELAHLPCLCVGIVSGLSGHCIPDVVNSLLSDSLLPASAVYLCSLQEVWLTTAQVTHPELTGFDQIWPHLPKINQRPQDRSETTTQPTANITYHDVAVAVSCKNLRLRPPSSGSMQRWPLLYSAIYYYYYYYWKW